MKVIHAAGIVAIIMILSALNTYCHGALAESSRYSDIEIYETKITGQDSDSDGKNDRVKVYMDIDSYYWWSSPDIRVDVYLFPPGVVASNSSGLEVDYNGTTYNPDDDYDEEFTFYLDVECEMEHGTYTVLVEVYSTEDDEDFDSDESTLELYPKGYISHYVCCSCSESEIEMSLGQSRAITVNVANEADEDDMITLELIPDNTDWSATLSTYNKNINRRTSDTVTLTITAPTDKSKARLVNLEFIATSSDSSVKDTLDIVAFIGLVDFEIDDSDLEIDPSTPNIGQKVEISAEVDNMGLVNATSFHVTLYIDSDEVDRERVSYLPAGDSTIVSFIWKATKGSHNVNVEVDEDDALDEFIDDNNNASAAFTVNTADISIPSSGYELSKEMPNEGDNTSLTVTMKNSGTAVAKNVNITMYMGTKDMGTIEVPEIGKNDDVKSVTFTWTAGNGEYIVRLVIDESNKLPEINEDNNELMFSLKVNGRPASSFSTDSKKITVGETIEFDATGSTDEDGNISQYFFDFGDNQNSGWVSQPTVTHAYTTSGSYNATVKVKDNNGAESELSSPIVITVEKEEESTGLFGSDGSGMVYVMVGIVLVVVIAVILIFAMRNKKRSDVSGQSAKSGPDQVYIPPPPQPSASKGLAPQNWSTPKESPPPPLLNASVESGGGPSKQLPPPPPSPSKPMQGQKKRFCSNCGQPVSGTFCSGCGSKVQ